MEEVLVLFWQSHVKKKTAFGMQRKIIFFYVLLTTQLFFSLDHRVIAPPTGVGACLAFGIGE